MLLVYAFQFKRDPTKWSKAQWRQVATELARRVRPGIMESVMPEAFQRRQRGGAPEKFSATQAREILKDADALRAQMRKELGRKVLWIEVCEAAVRRSLPNLPERKVLPLARKWLIKLNNLRKKVSKSKG